MTIPLSIEQMEAQYQGEWVLLADIESDPGPILRRAKVIWHSTDRDECWARADGLTSANIGVLYFGDWSTEEQPIPML